MIKLLLLLDLLAIATVSLIYAILTLRINDKEERENYNIDSSNSVLTLTGITSIVLYILWMIEVSPLSEIFDPLRIELPIWIVITGLIMDTVGSILFVWARIARGVIAPAWGLTNSMKLITSGPFRWIRHPSYSGYFRWFIGLFLVTRNPLFLVTTPGIIAYMKVVESEEILLELHFGEEFLTYKSRTRKFIPFVW